MLNVPPPAWAFLYLIIMTNDRLSIQWSAGSRCSALSVISRCRRDECRDHLHIASATGSRPGVANPMTFAVQRPRQARPARVGA